MTPAITSAAIALSMVRLLQNAGFLRAPDVPVDVLLTPTASHSRYAASGPQGSASRRLPLVMSEDRVKAVNVVRDGERATAPAPGPLA